MQLIEHLPTMHKALDLIPSISLNREAGEMTHMVSAEDRVPGSQGLQLWLCRRSDALFWPNQTL